MPYWFRKSFSQDRFIARQRDGEGGDQFKEILDTKSNSSPKKVEATVGFIKKSESVAIEVKTVTKPEAKSARVIPATASTASAKSIKETVTEDVFKKAEAAREVAIAKTKEFDEKRGIAIQNLRNASSPEVKDRYRREIEEASKGRAEGYKALSDANKIIDAYHQQQKIQITPKVTTVATGDKTTAEKRAEIAEKKAELLARREELLARKAAREVAQNSEAAVKKADAYMKTALTSIEIYNEQLKKAIDPVAIKDIQAKIKAEEKKRDSNTNVVVDDLISSLLGSSQAPAAVQIAPTVAKKPEVVLQEPMPAVTKISVPKDLKDKEYLERCENKIREMKLREDKYAQEKAQHSEGGDGIKKLQRAFAIEMRQLIVEFDANMRVLDDRNAAKIFFKNTKQLDGLIDEVLEMRLRNKFMVAQVEYNSLPAGNGDVGASIKKANSGVDMESKFIKYKEHQLSKLEPSSEQAKSIKEQIVEARENSLVHQAGLVSLMGDLNKQIDDLNQDKVSRRILRDSKEEKEQDLKIAGLIYDVALLNKEVNHLAIMNGDNKSKELISAANKGAERAEQALNVAKHEVEMTKAPAPLAPPPVLAIPSLEVAKVRPLPTPPVAKPAEDNSARLVLEANFENKERALVEARTEVERLAKERDDAKAKHKETQSPEDFKAVDLAVINYNKAKVAVQEAKINALEAGANLNASGKNVQLDDKLKIAIEKQALVEKREKLDRALKEFETKDHIFLTAEAIKKQDKEVKDKEAKPEVKEKSKLRMLIEKFKPTKREDHAKAEKDKKAQKEKEGRTP